MPDGELSTVWFSLAQRLAQTPLAEAGWLRMEGGLRAVLARNHARLISTLWTHRCALIVQIAEIEEVVQPEQAYDHLSFTLAITDGEQTHLAQMRTSEQYQKNAIIRINELQLSQAHGFPVFILTDVTTIKAEDQNNRRSNFFSAPPLFLPSTPNQLFFCADCARKKRTNAHFHVAVVARHTERNDIPSNVHMPPKMFIKIRPTTRLSKMIRVYCERFNLPKSNVHFVFFGNRIAPESRATCEQLRIENMDEIDVLFNNGDEEKTEELPIS